MRNKIVAGLALLLGGGAIRNLIDPQPFAIADWLLSVIFVVIGIVMLVKKA
jgi:hypothetical protein